MSGLPPTGTHTIGFTLPIFSAICSTFNFCKKLISFQKDNFRFESRHEELVIKHSPTRNLFINFNEFYNNLFSLSEQLLYVVLYFFCLHCPGRLHHLQR